MKKNVKMILFSILITQIMIFSILRRLSYPNWKSLALFGLEGLGFLLIWKGDKE